MDGMLIKSGIKLETDIVKSQEIGRAPAWFDRPSLEGWFSPLRGFISRDLLALFLSTALFEIAGNVVYVMLMERAFDLGGGAVSVGLFLVLQAGAQLILGSLIGSYADKLGARKTGIVGVVALAVLALSLAFTRTVYGLYLIAILLTAARMFVITSRTPLISRITRPSIYISSNITIYVLSGFGLFVGPALGATLYLIWRDPVLPFIAASAMFALAIAPLLIIPASKYENLMVQSRSLLEEVRIGWKHITLNRPVSEVLSCLAISSVVFGALMPTLTLVAKQAGLGTEGSGILVAALGLGWSLGPLSAKKLVRKMGYSNALLATGLLSPLALLLVGYLDTIWGMLLGLAIAAFSGAGLNVIVITIVQRLTPRHIQGSVMGAQQALSGLVWMVSAAVITGLLNLPPVQSSPKMIYPTMGVIGATLMLICLAVGRRSARKIFDDTNNGWS